MDQNFNLSAQNRLGEGGEAEVFGLDSDRIIRLFRSGTNIADVNRRTTLLAEIATGARGLPFATPEPLETGETVGRHFTLEKRIPGTSLLQGLETARGAQRRRLIEQYMEIGWQIGQIDVTRPYFGEMSHADPIQAPSWEAYLVERSTRSLAASPLAHIDPSDFVRPLLQGEIEPGLVHLDYFPGNVMAAGGQITAVIDFGYATIIGDRRMNGLVAAAHLVTPRITPTVTAEDREIAFAWLEAHGLFEYYENGLPWLAAYWTFAWDDTPLFEWCRSILVG